MFIIKILKKSFQNSALCATGAIWTRYCLVITPINYYLSSVNFFVMCSGLLQLCRIAHYRYTNPDWEQKQHSPQVEEL
ncbi:hypothetical protein COOONC_04607 [Cooperia oncophora]